MPVLTEDMKSVVRAQRLGYVATVSAEGLPNVSPKGSVAVWDDDHLVFADVESPHTIRNLETNPHIEVNVVDPTLRKGFRFSGTAEVLRAGDQYLEDPRALQGRRRGHPSGPGDRGDQGAGGLRGRVPVLPHGIDRGRSARPVGRMAPEGERQDGHGPDSAQRLLGTPRPSMSGLFPANATTVADLAAVLEVTMAVILLVGVFLVRRGHVRLHRILQSSVILVNIPIVLYAMIPPYLMYVAPSVPGGLGQAGILVPTIMLFAGATAELLGVYIILVAGTNWVPARFRFRRYKLWMRTELVLWWGVVIAGLTTYWLFFVPGASL